ncbi:MAG: PAS domain S-box protein [candidate division Zixibacteria bacterium]|nr:PAS domain S-box protein [candidate division Zixibacteria bacterium]
MNNNLDEIGSHDPQKSVNLLDKTKTDPFYKALLESTMDGFWIMDLEGNLLEVNDRYCEMSGYSREELTSMNVLDLDVSETKSNVLERIDSIGKEGFIRFETKHRGKDGSIIHLEVSANYLDENRYFGFFRDISDRIQAEKKLRSREEQLRLFIEHAPVAVAMFDIEMRYIITSKRWLKDARIVNKDIIGMSHYEVMPNLPERWKTIHKSCLHGNVEGGDEEKFVYPDGSIDWLKWEARPWLDDNGEVGGTIVFTEVITEKKRHEQDLMESRERFHAIADYTYDWENWVDNEGNLLWVNPAVERITGYTVEDCLKMEDFPIPIIYEEDRDRVENYYRMATSGLTGDDFDFRIRRRDGRVVWAAVSWQPIYDSNGNSIGHRSSIRDISRRKEIEERLRLSEKKYREMYENLPDASAAVDLQGRIMEFNPAFKALLGYKNDNDIYSLTYEDITPPEWHKTEKDIIENQVLKRGYSDLYEKEYRDKYGNGIPIELRTFLIKNEEDEPEGMWASIRDITERKRLEKLTLERESHYRMLFEDSPISLWEIDMSEVKKIIDEITAEGIKDIPKYLRANAMEFADVVSRAKIIDINKATVKFLKAEGAKERCYDLNNFFTNESYQAFVDVSMKFQEGRYSHSSETVVNTFDGEKKHISFRVSLAPGHEEDWSKMYVSWIDITDAKNAEESLAAERERLAITLRSIGDGVITTDKAGKITLLNRMAEKIIGWTEEEALNTPFQKIFTIIDEKSRKPADNIVEKVLLEKVIIALGNQTILITKDGSERLIALSGAPIRDREFRIIGVVIVFRDITETKRLQEFAARAQRLETAGRIAGQVAHDFNNLLAPLRSYPELIRQELDSNHPACQYTEDIDIAVERIAEINQQLLTLGRRGYYNIHTLDIRKIVTDVIDSIEPLPGEIKIRKEFAPDLKKTRGGQTQIFRAIMNIIVNACDAIDGRGEITITARNCKVSGKTGRLNKIPSGNYVCLSISDNGPGIPENIRNRIFDPFFTTKITDGKRGSGLGLSVVHSVMEDHQAYIDIDSAENEGTTFYLYFPIKSENSTLNYEEPVAGGNERILVVDDDTIQLDVSRRILEKLGYKVYTAINSQETFQLLKQNSFDLVIIDLIMPDDIDGSELFAGIIDKNPNQKAIIVSGYGDSEKIKRALEMGAGSFLQKPLTMRGLAVSVRKVLDRVNV